MSPILRYRSHSVPVPGDPLPAAVRVARRAGDEPFVLYERQDTWSVALGAAVELTVTPTAVRRSGPDGERSVPWRYHPRTALRELTADLPVEEWTAYGTAAFELAYAGGPAHADLPANAALLHLIVPRTEVRLRGGIATVRALDPADATTAAALDALAADAGEDEPELVDVDPGRGDAELYRKAVHTAVREIQEGSLRKVILSRVVPVPEPVDLVATYLHGRRHNTPARSFLLSLGGVRAAGFSPEIVLAVDAEGRVRTQPLAGTRALTGDADVDVRLRRDLLDDPKEVYEHAVSVRTSVQELETVCAPDSVRVAGFMAVKPRGTAQHLGSDLHGRLARDRDGWDALSALFPAVTVSGIPKAEAYAAIRRLETEPRGLYGGAVLTVGWDGAFDAALVLRSVFQRDGRTWLRAGAGIVGQSLPEREFTETCEKLRSVSQSVVRAARPATRPTASSAAGSTAQPADSSAAVPGTSPAARPATSSVAGPGTSSAARPAAPAGVLGLDEMRRDVAEALRRPEPEVEDEVSLIVQGLDSVGLMTVVSKWSAYGIRLKLADLARDPRLAAWAELARAHHAATPGPEGG